MKGIRFLPVFVIVVGYSFCCTAVEVLGTKRLTYKRNSFQSVNGNCSERRHQQIENWMPEYCPSMRDILHVLYTPSDEIKHCGQYLYEGLKECYGDTLAFHFEQYFVVNETGAECIDNHNISVADDCLKSVSMTHEHCESNCASLMNYMSEIYGCCFSTLVWRKANLRWPR